jgi:hypothetical protein
MHTVAQPAAERQPGYFVFSLDTELAWGYFDLDDARARLFTPDGTRERQAIRRVLDICNEFGIVGTWALVGHLFYARCEECEQCPVLAWRGAYRSFEDIYQTEHPLWYAPEVVEWLLQHRDRHEIAFHGYTHELFSRMDREAARLDIQEWLRVARRRDVVPETVIFPRNQVAHLDLFRQAGFVCYRSNETTPSVWRWRAVGKLLKSLDHILAWTTPPIYRLDDLPAAGLVDVCSSLHLFGFNRRLEQWLDGMNLHTLRMRGAVRAVQQAAREQKMVHMWAHPWEFRTNKDFDKLRYLFDAVAREVDAGRIQSVGMAELAHIVRARHIAGHRALPAGHAAESLVPVT